MSAMTRLLKWLVHWEDGVGFKAGILVRGPNGKATRGSRIADCCAIFFVCGLFVAMALHKQGIL